MRVLHVTPSFAPAWSYGGPIEATLRLAQSLRSVGVDVDVASTTADRARDLPFPTESWVEFEGVRVRYFRRDLKVDYSPSRPLLRWLLDRVNEYDLVHVTSVFSFPSLAAGFAARRSNVPYLVSPHGSLSRRAFANKRWKKLPYWLTLERSNLTRAAAIHTSSTMEREDVLRLMPRSRVFVVPNGNTENDPPTVTRHPNRIVFLGRVHMQKGFDVLVPALSLIARTNPEVETVIAGPDDAGDWRRVETLLSSVEPHPKVRYVGPIYGAKRFELLASAAVFVLPSHGESFAMSVVEAMACGTPVVVSRNCPWSDVQEHGAGAWVENRPPELARALLRILSDPALGRRMGAAGLALAREYSWPAVARRMAAHYEELIAQARA